MMTDVNCVRGLPYMTFAKKSDGGSINARKFAYRQCNIDLADREWGGGKIPNFCGRHIWKPQMWNVKSRAPHVSMEGVERDVRSTRKGVISN